MMTSFKLSEISKNTLVGRDIGQQVREKIRSLSTECNGIIIDMENKTAISPSFLDEAIVSLVLEYGKENFSKHIQLININSGIKSLMNTILADRIARNKID